MRKFRIVSHAVEGDKTDTLSVRGICAGPHYAAGEYIGLHHAGYRFTGGLQYEKPNLWTGEAYNDTHGVKLYIYEE